MNLAVHIGGAMQIVVAVFAGVLIVGAVGASLASIVIRSRMRRGTWRWCEEGGRFVRSPPFIRVAPPVGMGVMSSSSMELAVSQLRDVVRWHYYGLAYFDAPEPSEMAGIPASMVATIANCSEEDMSTLRDEAEQWASLSREGLTVETWEDARTLLEVRQR